MFVFGKASERELVGVQPPIVAAARRALQLSTVDFAVHEGLRTAARQRELVASGASRTLDSFHLTGHAVDLVPYVSGRLQWQMPLCIRVAQAMHQASAELALPIIWGAVWDRELGSMSPDYLDEHIAEYVERYRKRFGPDRHPLIDGPHFQMRRAA
jgi:peptidoglycan L-alanyl-D-glutamate endopeptidase CwlK